MQATHFPEAGAPSVLREASVGAGIVTSSTAGPTTSGVGVGGRRVRQSEPRPEGIKRQVTEPHGLGAASETAVSLIVGTTAYGLNTHRLIPDRDST